jgi:hypothetical protein
MSEFSIAEQVLAQWGSSAEKLPTSKKEESDWLAVLGGFRLLIEEKTKFDNPEHTTARSEAFVTNQLYSTVASLSRNNTISGIVKKAAGQLTSSAINVAHDARIIWITSFGFDAEAKSYQTLSTLYGSTKAFTLEDSALRECYFFHQSDFYRFRDQIDGALVAFNYGDLVTMKLCLNPYAPRWQALRDSPFASKLPNGLIDPITEEAIGYSYVADTNIDRNNQEAVLNYLRAKYSKPTMLTMEMNMASALITAPVVR